MNLSWPICPTCEKPCETFTMTGCEGAQQYMPSRSFIMRGDKTYHLGCEPREVYPPEQEISEGWQLVPKEPTTAMLMAGKMTDTVKERYQAQLAAAPKKEGK